MRLTTLLLCLFYSLPAFSQGGPNDAAAIVSGLVSLTDGTTAPSGIVSFYRVEPPPAVGAPQAVQHAPVRPYGSFTVHLTPGTYRVCTQVWEVAGLDPCLWSDPAPTVTVGADTRTLTFPITLAAGKFVRLRVDDSSKQLLASPKVHVDSDLRFGVMTSSGFVRPATIESSDSSGIVYRGILPLDNSAPLLLHHHKIALADAQGQTFSDTEWSDISNSYSPQVLTKQVLSPKGNTGKKNPDITLSVTGLLSE